MPQTRTMTELQPPGMVSYFGNSSAPTGWLIANGAAISRTTYSDLFATIGTTYGAGDGSSTFNIPDLRGEFIRGWDGGRGIDSGRGNTPRGFGTLQKGTAQSYNVPNNEGAGGSVGAGNDNNPESGWIAYQADYVPQSDYPDTASIHNNSGPTNSGEWLNDEGWGGGAQRPRNVALLICIKY